MVLWWVQSSFNKRNVDEKKEKGNSLSSIEELKRDFEMTSQAVDNNEALLEKVIQALSDSIKCFNNFLDTQLKTGSGRECQSSPDYTIVSRSSFFRVEGSSTKSDKHLQHLTNVCILRLSQPSFFQIRLLFGTQSGLHLCTTITTRNLKTWNMKTATSSLSFINFSTNEAFTFES